MEIDEYYSDTDAHDLSLLKGNENGQLSFDVSGEFNLTDDGEVIDRCQSNAENGSSVESQAIIAIAIIVIGLIFNGIAIFVIIQLKDYKKVVSHWYVLHLSIADLILLLHLPFKTSQHFYGYWIYGSWFCTYIQGIFMTSYYAGILFLTVMSFDRYVAIVHPVSAKWRKIRTRYNANIVTLVVWTISLLLSVPLWAFSNAEHCTCAFDFGDKFQYPVNETVSKEDLHALLYNEDVDIVKDYGPDYMDNLADEGNGGISIKQNCKYNDMSLRFSIWIVCNFIVTFVIPIIIMGICYSLILWRVLHPAISSAHTTSYRRRKSSENSTRKDSLGKSSFRTSSSSSTSSSHRLSRKGKVTFVVASLVACFLICWLPFHMIHMMKMYGGIPVPSKNEGICDTITDITHLLAYSNSMLNPILYTFLGSDFRRRLKSATKSFRRRRASTGFSKGNRTARSSVPTYGRSQGTGAGGHHKAMEGPSAYPMNTIHSMVSKHYSQDLNERSQFLSTRRTECSSRCEMDALQFSDLSESRMIH